MVAAGNRDDINRYPDPQPRMLLTALAKFYGVGPDQVLATRGSDDGIDLLMRCFCRGGTDEVIVCPPTFGMYEIAARIQGAGVRSVPLEANGFALDCRRHHGRGGPCTRLVFLCSPNNPTGNLIDPEMLAALCTALRGRALVVVDEAYIEFADASSRRGHAAEVRQPGGAAHAVQGHRSGRRALWRLARGPRGGAGAAQTDATLSAVAADHRAGDCAALGIAGRRQLQVRVQIIRTERERLATALRVRLR